MQGVSSVISCMIAQDEIGEENLKIGCEPSGKKFNEIGLLNDKIPHNPLINSGGILNCSKIFEHARPDRKFQYYVAKVKDLIGKPKVDFAHEHCLAELMKNHKNNSIAYNLQEVGLIPENAKISAILEFFAQTQCISLDLNDFATIAATLANGGIQPETGKRTTH